jgi:uncharacterized damage-inducible protein DinB
MIYTSVAQIYGAKQQTFETLTRETLTLSNAQSGFRIAEGQWTIAEIVEHLALVESRLLRLTSVTSLKLERAGETSSEAAGLNIEIPDGAERNDVFKVKTKEEYEPTGNVSIVDSLKLLQTLHDDLCALRPRLERVNLNAVSFDHWVLGALTLGQWLAFIGIHEQRHLGQIQSILGSAKFPGR